MARLRDAGAIVIGKTNVPTLAADVQTTNPLFGTTANPWDRARSAGGSSGGAAAALATGMTPAELGSDLAGSIRIPAAWCGVAGHKPTWGVVPIRGHVPPHPGTLHATDVETAGPMARAVSDLPLLLDVLAGPDDRAARAWTLRLPPPRDEPRRLRMAVWFDEEDCPTDVAVLAALRQTADRLADAGVEIVEARPAVDLAAHREVSYALLQAVAGARLPDHVRARLASVAAAADDPATPFQQAAAGMTQDHARWTAYDQQRRQHRAVFDAFLDDVDVLLTPAVGVPAIPHLDEGTFYTRTITVDRGPGGLVERPYADLSFWALLVGSVHLPATVVPIGTTSSGLPVGLQIAAGSFRDRTTLAAAALVAEIVGAPAVPCEPV